MAGDSLPRMRAIQISEFGGPDVMQLVDLEVPEPGDDQVLIRVTRAGINWADTHQVENSYLAKFELPLIPGTEVAGVVERPADGFEAGQRVVAMTGTGGYAEYAVAPVSQTFAIPDGVDDELALALLVQGLTAWHLYRTCAKVQEGESVVVVSGAGGVGSLAVQLGHHMGAGRVIATASSPEKRELTLELGADAAVDPDSEDLTAALVEANEGRRVDAVFEMAGGRIFDGSLRALAPFGRMVAYGIAGREPNEVQTGLLMRKSWSVVGFWLMHCMLRPEEMLRRPLADLYERAARGEVRAVPGGTYGLTEARRAHEDLRARTTRGKLLLDPAS
jgi:NADPH:quinone reductase